MLVASIPWPDLDRRWGEAARGALLDSADVEASETGCPFAARCPDAMSICRSVPPPAVPHGDTIAACHLLAPTA